ncbi:MAG: peptide chain release factor N(5)-glutamine methyltransferase [Gammaproteobacteria bacterium]|jgi:release factor glutamine methyltransferase|nr:peptide chain release factor N(5)-glutamine methyltransferase [Gammaproteobacteria bacterium]
MLNDPASSAHQHGLPSRLREAVTAAASALATALRTPNGVPKSDAPHIDTLREAEALVLCRLGLPRSTLYSDPDRILSTIERANIEAWLARRCRGEPLAYLIGEREFWSLNFEVSPAVLVPRPETELLVERALRIGDELERAGNALPHVLDLGTGSGAIAIALAHERPGWRVMAVERSESALAVARRNASRHAVPNLELLQGDWFEPVSHQRFDIVVSNPPYVSADDPLLGGDSLRHEPREALTPGPDALRDLARIIDEAPRYLEAGGRLLLEHGARQGEPLRSKLVARGFAHVVSHTDLSGQERVTEGQWS